MDLGVLKLRILFSLLLVPTLDIITSNSKNENTTDEVAISLAIEFIWAFRKYLGTFKLLQGALPI